MRMRIRVKTSSEIGDSRWDADWREVEGGKRENEQLTANG